MVVSYWECGVMGARVPWEHEAQFESDISSRGILSIGRLPGPYPGGVGSSPAPAISSKRKETTTMRSTVLTREMNQIKKNQFWFCIQKTGFFVMSLSDYVDHVKCRL